MNQRQRAVIEWYIRRNGVTSPGLREDLCDHISCLVEKELTAGKNFDVALRSVLKRFGSLRSIQVQTDQEVHRSVKFDTFIRVSNYLFVFLYFLLGTAFLTFPLIALITGAGWIGLCFAPMVLLGYIIVFTRINYRKFDIIPFRKSFSPVQITF